MDTSNGSSRRDFLTGFTALGAGALMSRAKLGAQAPASNPRLIDCHHHFVSPAYLKALTAKDGHHVAGYTTHFGLNGLKDYTPARDIEAMDQDGAAVSLLSCTTPGAWFGNPEETRGMARELNEFGAKMVSDYKGRFGLFAVLPLPTIEDSLREDRIRIRYASRRRRGSGVELWRPLAGRPGISAGVR